MLETRFGRAIATDHRPNRSTTHGPSSHHCQPAVPAATHQVRLTLTIGISDPSKIKQSSLQETTILYSRLVVLKECDCKAIHWKHKFSSLLICAGNRERPVQNPRENSRRILTGISSGPQVFGYLPVRTTLPTGRFRIPCVSRLTGIPQSDGHKRTMSVCLTNTDGPCPSVR